MNDSTQVKGEHTYRDFSCVREEVKQECELAPEPNFAEKLHCMLDKLQLEGLDHVASWQPHGRCFIVRKPLMFQKHVLPLWFRHSNFASFQRQLNLYGFRRLTAGRDKGAYYHEMFLRGKRFLAQRMKRTKVKGTGVRKRVSPETEPDFYRMPSLPYHPTVRRSYAPPTYQNPNILHNTPPPPPPSFGGPPFFAGPPPPKVTPIRHELPILSSPPRQMIAPSVRSNFMELSQMHNANPSMFPPGCVVLLVQPPSTASPTSPTPPPLLPPPPLPLPHLNQHPTAVSSRFPLPPQQSGDVPGMYSSGFKRLNHYY